MTSYEQDREALQAQKSAPAETALDLIVGQSQQEMQAALVIAQRFGRDERLVRERIVTWARDPDNAQAARFSYPRKDADGKEVSISDATIRCAEGVAQAWGHMRCGFQVLEDSGAEAKVRAYAWDLLSNLFAEASFVVPFVRKAKGVYRKLDDPRDQYEHTANMASRRLRTCVFRVLPSWVKSLALREADETVEKAAPAESGKAEAAFVNMGVTKPMLEAYMGKGLEALNRADYRKLRNLYNAIHEGFAKISDIFGPAGGSEPASNQESTGKTAGGAADIKAQADAERAKKPASQESAGKTDTPETGTPAQAEDAEATSARQSQDRQEKPAELIGRAEAFARKWSSAAALPLPARKAVLNLCRDEAIESVEALAGALAEPGIAQRPYWGDKVFGQVSEALRGVYKAPAAPTEVQIAAWRTKPREDLEREFDHLYTVLSSAPQAEAETGKIIADAGIGSLADVAVKTQDELAALVAALGEVARRHTREG